MLQQNRLQRFNSLGLANVSNSRAGLLATILQLQGRGLGGLQPEQAGVSWRQLLFTSRQQQQEGHGPPHSLDSVELLCLDLKLWTEKPSSSSRAGACGGLSCSCVAALVCSRLCTGGWTRARAGGVSRPGAGHHTFCLQAALTRGSRSCRGGGWGGSSQLRPVQ